MDERPEPPTDVDPGAEDEARDPVARRLHGAADAYGLVLAFLLALLVLPAVLPDEPWSRVLLACVAVASILLALASSRIPRWLLLVVTILAALVPLTAALRNRGTGYTAVESGILAALMLITAGAILNRIARHRKITLRTLYGAIAVYLLLGIAFSFVYQGLEQQDDDAIKGTAIDDRNGYTYYSFVTQTTVGYGDIVPVNKAARTAAIFQMLSGQVFLVVIVARVVSMLGREREVDMIARPRVREALRTEKPPVVGED